MRSWCFCALNLTSIFYYFRMQSPPGTWAFLGKTGYGNYLGRIYSLICFLLNEASPQPTAVPSAVITPLQYFPAFVYVLVRTSTSFLSHQIQNITFALLYRQINIKVVRWLRHNKYEYWKLFLSSEIFKFAFELVPNKYILARLKQSI